MLSSLHITNFALIDDLSVEFTAGLAIITGETGAGKSILMDALSLALGDRADTAMIRNGAQKATIEAIFTDVDEPNITSKLSDLGTGWNGNLIVRRELSTKGLSRCFVNDTPVQVGTLKELGDLLVDIHGQNEHQSLLRTETHKGVLDQFGDLDTLREKFTSDFIRFSDSVRRLREACVKKNSIDERKAVIAYRLKEIDAVRPSVNEDEEIEKELRVAEHGERLTALSVELLGLLYDGDQNASDQLGKAKKQMLELASIDPSARLWSEELLSAIGQIDDVSHSLRSYLETLEFKPDHCETLRARSAELNALKRKLRASLPEIVALAEELRQEQRAFESLDDTIADLERSVVVDRAAASEKAVLLTAARRRTAETLEKAVSAELKHLGIPYSKFETKFSMRPGREMDELFLLNGKEMICADSSGWDVVEFFLSTNVGEDIKPLIKVVSGGEVSRIMLALKTIFAGKVAVPVMVFDEVEVGVSGEIALKVGRAMKRLAEKHQVLAITHVPQIAGAGNTHYLVEKHVEGKRTVTTVRSLDASQHIDEVARLLGGSGVTAATRQSAMELIESYS